MKSLRLRVATYNIHKGVVPGPSLRRRPMVKEMRQRLPHERLQHDIGQREWHAAGVGRTGR